ncbi:MAG TPA: SGNH/GDSL hydrolase family protein [Anaerolineales bacterium]|nr:SGNH/GDSL hydrolase family protein [Anaerolineales bacterium]
MNKSFFLTIFSLLFIFFAVGCASKPDVPEEPYRILFIGDSTTSRNDIPGKFQKLAELGGHEVVVESSTRDATSLATHTRLPQTTVKFEDKEWDIVILQETETVLLNPESLQEFTMPIIENYVDIVDEMGGVILLYSSIGFRDGLGDYEEFSYLDDYESSQDAVDTAYLEIGSEYGLSIAPVGEVWRAVYDTEPDFDLWQIDGLHPSPEGAYLAACVFYAAIYNQSPLDLPISDDFGIDQAAIERIHQIAAEVVLENQVQHRLPLFTP